MESSTAMSNDELVRHIRKRRSEAHIDHLLASSGEDRRRQADDITSHGLVPSLVGTLRHELNRSAERLPAVDPFVTIGDTIIRIMDIEATEREYASLTSQVKQLLKTQLAPFIGREARAVIATREVACWRVAEGLVGEDFLSIYLMATTGEAYAHWLHAGESFAEYLENDRLMEGSFTELTNLITQVKSHRKSAELAAEAAKPVDQEAIRAHLGGLE